MGTSLLSASPLHASLNPSSGVYFDFFQTIVVPQLSRQPDGPAGFWSGTLLRECRLDSCVMDAVVGIGALSRARHDGLHPAPHHKLQKFGPLSCRHYYTALQHYTRAIAKFGRRIKAIAQAAISPRTLLVCTILFSIFELLHGNTHAFDHLIANGLQTFRNKHLLSTNKRQQQIQHQPVQQQHQQQPRAIAPTTLDDAEMYDAECFLARTATWSAIFSPMYPRSRHIMASMTSLYELGALPPDRQGSSVGEFWRRWWQFVTMAVIWHLRVQTIRGQNRLGDSVDAELRKEQRLLLERTSLWADETQARLDEITGDNDHFSRHILTMLVFEIRICYWSGYYALESSEMAWQSCKDECSKILDMACDTVAELTTTMRYESLVSDGLMIGLLQLARECRDWTIRSRALDLAKRLIMPSSTWHVKSFVLGVTACVAAEEKGRDGVTGHIPLSERYDWTDGSWNDNFTELHVTITSRDEYQHGRYKQKQMVLGSEMLQVCDDLSTWSL